MTKFKELVMSMNPDTSMESDAMRMRRRSADLAKDYAEPQLVAAMNGGAREIIPPSSASAPQKQPMRLYAKGGHVKKEVTVPRNKHGRCI